MRRSVALSWILAALAFFLLVLSLTGDGAGPFQMGVLTSMIWSYVVLVGGVALGLWAAAKRRPLQPEEQTA